MPDGQPSHSHWSGPPAMRGLAGRFSACPLVGLAHTGSALHAPKPGLRFACPVVPLWSMCVDRGVFARYGARTRLVDTSGIPSDAPSIALFCQIGNPVGRASPESDGILNNRPRFSALWLLPECTICDIMATIWGLSRPRQKELAMGSSSLRGTRMPGSAAVIAAATARACLLVPARRRRRGNGLSPGDGEPPPCPEPEGSAQVHSLLVASDQAAERLHALHPGSHHQCPGRGSSPQHQPGPCCRLSNPRFPEEVLGRLGGPHDLRTP